MNPSISPMGNGCKLCAGCTGCMFCGPSAIAAAGAAGFGKVIENINTRYGKGFLYKIKDGNSNAKNCGAFTSNPSITPEGEIKFCAMDNQTVIKSLGNVFKEDIGQLFSNNYQLMNMIRGIQAPDYTSKECSGCEKKYFCSYCIIRGLVAAKEKGFENCAWYSQYIPNEFRRLLI